MGRSKSLATVAIVVVSIVGCRGLDSDEASKIFADCLERNGVEAEDVVVTMDGDTVGEISVAILSERDVAYEPALREACTEEVELND
ncbi:MAG TPA: hypothetical protein VIW46_13405 [Acidimicrobiia bacterium]|jgi:hypothetical protein